MSFFSSSKDKEKKEKKGDFSSQHEANVVQKTGRCIDNVVAALARSIYDKDKETRHGVALSLVDISKKEPELVITSCMEVVLASILKKEKIDHGHRVDLLRIIGRVVDDQKSNLAEDLITRIVSFAINEMTATKDVVSDLQSAASHIIVSLGTVQPDSVMPAILKLIQPGVLPHYFILKTLADFAVAHPLHFVPQTSDVMARILPTLGQIKHGHMRYMFACTLSQLSEAIILYFDNPERSGSCTAEDFQHETYTAFELLFNRWLVDKEDPVRLATCQALGNMSMTISRDHFENMVPKLVPAMMGLYKRAGKPEQQLGTTQGIVKLFEAGVLNGSRVLEGQLPLILQTLFPLTCAAPTVESGVTNAHAVKIRGEMMRCFEVLSLVFATEVVNFLIEKMGAREVPLRIGAIDILKHLITRLTVEMNPLKELVVSGVRQLTGEADDKVKRALSQLLMVMGTENYLVFEGGQSLVTFLVRQAANTSSAGEGAQLRHMSEQILDRFASNVESMENVLWPFLLESVIPPQLQSALPTVLQCVSTIGTRKVANDDDKYGINFDAQVNLPKPQALVARLMTILCRPLESNKTMGVRVLESLVVLGPVIHPNIGALWTPTVPRLIQYLENKKDTEEWNDKLWEDLVMRLFKETVECVKEEEWLLTLSEYLGEQFDLYEKTPEMKRYVFRFLGFVLQKSTKRQMVRSKLDRMFSLLNHESESDRTGCAEAFGLCAVAHVDICIEKLQDVLKNDCVRKGSGFFGLVKDKSEAQVDVVKSSVALCLGHVVSGTPPNLLVTRVETHVLKNSLLPLLPDTRTLMRKECTIRSIGLIAEKLHPDNLDGNSFSLKQRDDLIGHLIIFASPRDVGDVNMAVRLHAVRACTALIRLAPPVTEDVENKLVETMVKFLTLAPVATGGAASEKDRDIITHLPELLETVSEMIATVLRNQPTVECLGRLLANLEKWIHSDKAVHQRQRALVHTILLLKNYIELIKDGTLKVRSSNLDSLGSHLANIIPRCCDVDVTVRTMAFECIELLLTIGHIYQQDGAVPDELPASLKRIRDLREQISTEDVGEQCTIVWGLATSLSELLPNDELAPLVRKLMTRAMDSKTETVSAAVVVLNAILQGKGASMGQDVPELVQGLVKNLGVSENEQTVNGILHSFRTIATHHLEAVTEEILLQPLPHSEHVVRCIQVVGKSKGLVEPFLNYLIDVINTNKMETVADPKKRGQMMQTAGTGPTAATSCIAHLFALPHLADMVQSKFPTIAATLLARFATAKDVTKGGNATKHASDALRAFLELIKETATLQVLDQEKLWDDLGTAKYTDCIATIVNVMLTPKPKQHRPLVDFVQTFLNGSDDKQRIAGVTIVAQLVESGDKEDSELLRNLINSLMAQGAHKLDGVRRQVMKGLGNIVANGEADVNSFSAHVLGALLSGVDDSSEDVALEAMNSLARIFKLIDEAKVGPVLINLSLKIKAAFSKSNPGLRKAGFSLFGTLCRFGGGLDNFADQIHLNLVTVILHCRDEDKDVREAAKVALGEIGVFLEQAELCALMQSAVDDNRPYFDDYLNELAALLVQHFGGNANMYVNACIDHFKSPWPVCMAHSAIFSAFLFAHLDEHTRARVDPDRLTKELIALLRAQSPLVRGKVAKGMALLVDF